MGTWGLNGTVIQLMPLPTAPPCCHCFVFYIFQCCFLDQQQFEAFVLLFQVYFCFKWKTKGLKACSALKTKTWTLKAWSAAPRDSHHLNASVFVFSLRLESQVFVMEVQTGGEVFLLLSQQLLQAKVSEHRHGRPAPSHRVALMFLTISRDVINLQAASCKGVMISVCIFFHLLTCEDWPVWSRTNIRLEHCNRSDLTDVLWLRVCVNTQKLQHKLVEGWSSFSNFYLRTITMRKVKTSVQRVTMLLKLLKHHWRTLKGKCKGLQSVRDFIFFFFLI